MSQPIPGDRTYIPKDQCVHRRLYRIRARNFSYGVFAEETCGFLGIRTKFGSRYVFSEYHWDHDYFPTVQPVEDLGIDLPDDIPCVEHLPGAWGRAHPDREVEWRPDEPGGKLGKWYYKDTGELEPGGGFIKRNTALFEWLDAQLSVLAEPPEE